MNDDIKDILNLSSFISDQQKKKKTKKDSEAKKKAEVANREVLSLTGGLFPIQPTPSLNIIQKNDSNKERKSDDRWVLYPIMFDEPNKPKINHWTRDNDKDKVYSYQKFNVKVDMVDYTSEEYEQHIKFLDTNWTKEETDYLWDLCHTFDLRFIVIHDRYDSKYDRSIEELKNRYYSVSKKLLEARGEFNNPLCAFKFDPAYERERKFHLEKFLMRTKEKNEEEKKLIEDIRKLEAIIKKEEKEQKNLQTIMRINFKEEDVASGEEEEEDKALNQIKEDRLNNFYNVTDMKVAYTRSSLMHVPLPISERMNKKLNLMLQELNIPQKPIPTEENEKLFDKLRERILKMLSLQKHLKRKEMERKKIEDAIEASKAKMNDFSKTPLKPDEPPRTIPKA